MRKRLHCNWVLAVVVGVLAVQFALPTVLAGGNKNCVYINWSRPYYSIQEAVNHAKSGDTIWICEGTYYECVQVEYKNLKIKGLTDDPRNVVIKPPYNGNGGNGEQEVNSTDGYYCEDGIYVYDADYVVIENLTVEGAYDRGIETNYVDNVEIEDVCVVYNGDDGINISDSEYVTLCDIYAYDNYDDGIDVNDGGEVYACDITSKKNYGDGFDVDTACNVEVEDSWFMYNEDDGLDMDDVGNVDNGDVQAMSGYNGSGYNGSDCGLIKIRRVLSEYNYDDGLEVDFSGELDVYYAEFSKNGDDGIDANCVGYIYLEKVGVRHNDDNGVAVNLDFIGEPTVDQDDCFTYYVYIKSSGIKYNYNVGLYLENVGEAKVRYSAIKGNGRNYILNGEEINL